MMIPIFLRSWILVILNNLLEMFDNYIIILYTTMVTRRLYKKRSYKKRRTIRKLKTTLRRKIQRGGGNPEEDLIKLILRIIPKLAPILLSNFNIFYDILKLIIQLSNGNMRYRGGSRMGEMNTLNQKGGGGFEEVKANLLDKLKALRKNMTNTKAQIIIDYFINKFQSLPEPKPLAQSQPQTPSQLPAINTEELLKEVVKTKAAGVDARPSFVPSGSSGFLSGFSKSKILVSGLSPDKIKDIIKKSYSDVQTKFISIIDTLISNIRAKTKNILTEDDINKIIELKNAIFQDMFSKFDDSKNIVGVIQSVMREQLADVSKRVLSNPTVQSLWSKVGPITTSPTAQSLSSKVGFITTSPTAQRLSSKVGSITTNPTAQRVLSKIGF